MSQLELQVVGSEAGKQPRIKFTTLNEASAVYRDFLNENGFGSRDGGQCFIYHGKEIVAHISYNGIVWPGKSWTPGSKPLWEAHS